MDIISNNHIIALIIIISSVVISALVKKIIDIIISNENDKLKTVKNYLYVLKMPISVGIVLLGMYLAFKVLPLPEKIYVILDEGFMVVSIFFITYLINRLINTFIEKYLISMVNRFGSNVASSIIKPLQQITTIIIFSFAIIFTLGNLGYDITSLIAGLGIGGLALAMASKETIENLIAGIILAFDRPFKIGDEIKIKGDDIWGIVEEIGIRSTKIRTFDDTLVVAPNRDLLSQKIENLSKRKKRRVLMTIGLTYDTPPEKLIKARDILLDIIKSHPSTVEPIRVHFTEYGDWSLNFRVEYFIKNEGFDHFLNVLNDINLKIKQEFYKEGIDFAFPTYTIYITQNDFQKPEFYH
ncbi:Mechanosensitive ion channel [Methanocaldococcus bathoardescens]|uniref:Mechanosensitive ion channel n=1 Tax=Methanocaldococcus bathoardescens TaxID=1301915 RepID=A0A076LE22_9EURY|nr:mechanosensitive ion channel family protein [Methanocaldococcus bathoardescens]AIJ06471.1 Mechanosensitive ion channel [Methanocaldococcus bathoardescens]